MPKLMESPPHSPIEVVTDFLHGVPVEDPYRWLEDQESPRTRAWIEEQNRYARAYLDNIPGRQRIRKRLQEFLDVETYDSIRKVGARYFYRKRLPQNEQPCIYMRDGAHGKDELLVDPTERNTGKYTAVMLVQVSNDGRYLVYEIKEGGEHTGAFAILDIKNRKTLPDILPRGYLRAICFTPDSDGFYYVHEPVNAKRPLYRAAFYHVLGTPFNDDQEIFFAGEDKKLRLFLVPDANRLGFLINRFHGNTYTDFYLRPFGSDSALEKVIEGATYSFVPVLWNGRILAITDCDAPNFRIVEVHARSDNKPKFVDLVAQTDARIDRWLVMGDRIFASYIRPTGAEVRIFDSNGENPVTLPVQRNETIRIVGRSTDSDELFFESESFAEPVSIWRFSVRKYERTLWAKRHIPFDPKNYTSFQSSYRSKDGVSIPIHLVGRRDVLATSDNPTIMTSYGGYGVSMTPQFSIFVAFLMERGCLFALPNIRGGSEFGIGWHSAAKRRNRQTAYDDFLSAAEWLVDTGRTSPGKLAIFGGSNSGLLVGAALTQRPDLFRAVVCIAPMLDMLRYHLFDNAHVWRDEFGSADDPDDFKALAGYSPYHHVRKDVAYPATMIVSGSADGGCNPLHARKMTARLQAANVSPFPVFLDYNAFRGHAPVLPLSVRIEALTDRMAFLCDQLHLSI